MVDKVIEYKYKASCQNDQAQIETKSGCPLKRQPIQHKLQMITKTHLVVKEGRQLVKHKHGYFDFECYTRTHIQKMLCRSLRLQSPTCTS